MQSLSLMISQMLELMLLVMTSILKDTFISICLSASWNKQLICKTLIACIFKKTDMLIGFFVLNMQATNTVCAKFALNSSKEIAKNRKNTYCLHRNTKIFKCSTWDVLLDLNTLFNKPKYLSEMSIRIKTCQCTKPIFIWIQEKVYIYIYIAWLSRSYKWSIWHNIILKFLKVGVFGGPMVVSMRYIPLDQAWIYIRHEIRSEVNYFFYDLSIYRELFKNSYGCCRITYTV